MAYNPNEPRDSHGRWGSISSGARSGAKRGSKIGRDLGLIQGSVASLHHNASFRGAASNIVGTAIIGHVVGGAAGGAVGAVSGAIKHHQRTQQKKLATQNPSPHVSVIPSSMRGKSHTTIHKTANGGLTVNLGKVKAYKA